MKRRSFLQAVSSGALAAPAVMGAQVRSSTDTGLPRRVLGRTGEKISVVCFPGLALTHQELDQEACTNGLHKAFDRGVNHFDVAPAYGKDGRCEKRMGIGLQGLDRSKIFLSCKTKKRDAAGAREELERSLTRLKTDYFDLYQLHCLIEPDEVTQALGPGGAMETILKAKQEGKVRHIGFSAHTTRAALAALNGFSFDSVMFPISFVEWMVADFGPKVVELAHKQGVAVLGMKALCKGAWAKGAKRSRKWWYPATEEPHEVGLALRFALSQPNVVTTIPPSFLDLLDRAIDAAQVDRPITDAETQELQTIAKDCQSVFARWENKVASRDPSQEWGCPGAHEWCPHEHA